MNEDIETIRIKFYKTANDLFHSTYQDFRNNANGVDRNGDENVYQLLRSKYSDTIRRLLEQMATELINSLKTQETQLKLRADLAATIHYFETEFMRKANES